MKVESPTGEKHNNQILTLACLSIPPMWLAGFTLKLILC